jgi:DNA-binding transcriptional MerR regulator
MSMTSMKLKTGQVAAILNINPKQLQNDVDAGYVQPIVTGQGRGSVRLYSFENVVRLKVLGLLVQAYGLERPRAATMLARAWPQPFTNQTEILIIPPTLTSIGEGIDLEPIRLPLREIVESIEQRVNEVVQTYHEKKRGRPVGWSQQMRQALTDVSAHLQEVSDEQITQEIETYRTQRRSRAQASVRP